jgi:hypothetical protein
VVALRSTPSTVQPSRFAIATASRFQIGTKACSRISSGCASKTRRAASRGYAGGIPQSRRESRMCVVATTGEAGSKMMMPPSDPFFHNPYVQADANFLR